MPKVSVLMPIYKTEESHLREAIDSILTQTYKDFEFLILNDSPSNTYLDAIVKSYNDNRLKYMKNKKNLGITPSRNKLINLSQGVYIAIMDHDDVALPKRIEKEVAFLDSHLDYGVVSSSYKKVGEEHIYKHPIDTDAIVNAFLSGKCYFPHPGAMIRRDVLLTNNLKYEKSFSPAEDFALWCRLVGKTKFYNIEEVLFLYREHETNTSKIQEKKMKNATNQIHKFVTKNNPTLNNNSHKEITYYKCIMGVKLFKIKYNQLQHTRMYYLCTLVPIIKDKRVNGIRKFYLFGILPFYLQKEKNNA